MKVISRLMMVVIRMGGVDSSSISYRVCWVSWMILLFMLCRLVLGCG